MIITFKWLREYLNTNLTNKEIISILEDLGLNLKTAYLNEELWSKLEIVKIIEKQKHPNADSLNLYSIIKNDGENLTIVCGDSSLQKGNYVIYAKPGTKMPSGEKLRKVKIRGIESPGMLCSASEINLPIQSNKVLLCFESDFGKTVIEAYDESFEIELTPNRGDAFSIIGIARLLANEGFGTFKSKEIEYQKAENKELIEVKSNDCKAIYCAVFKHKIQPTPAEIAKRLQLTGHNVLNIDIIDYTNYLAHELGQPMHVFDYDKIKNTNLKVEKLSSKKNFQTLTQETIELTEQTLVITADSEVIAWPSIIGGETSKVDQNSENILLETGIYNPDPIQRRKHKIITAAAKRNEYGLNPFILEESSNQLLKLTNAKAEYIQYKPFNEIKEIPFDFSQVKKILGIDIKKEDFIAKMIQKGFIFNENNTITPPGYKFFDIQTPNCIIEEFAISLYKNLKAINLPAAYPQHKQNTHILSNIALNEGFFECKNISLVQKEEEEFNVKPENREIQNYSNINYSILRGTLIPGLLTNFSWHIKNKQKYNSFFEEGLIYSETQTKIFTAIADNQSKLRTLLTKILESKNLTYNIQIKNINLNYSSNTACFYFQDKLCATFTTLKTSILKKYNITECYALEILIDNFESIIAPKPIKLQFPIYKDITLPLENQNSSSIIFNYLNNKNIYYNIKSVYKVDENLTNITIEIVLNETETPTSEVINQKISSIKMDILSALTSQNFQQNLEDNKKECKLTND